MKWNWRGGTPTTQKARRHARGALGRLHLATSTARPRRWPRRSGGGLDPGSRTITLCERAPVACSINQGRHGAHAIASLDVHRNLRDGKLVAPSDDKDLQRRSVLTARGGRQLRTTASPSFESALYNAGADGDASARRTIGRLPARARSLLSNTLDIRDRRIEDVNSRMHVRSLGSEMFGWARRLHVALEYNIARKEPCPLTNRSTSRDGNGTVTIDAEAVEAFVAGHRGPCLTASTSTATRRASRLRPTSGSLIAFACDHEPVDFGRHARRVAAAMCSTAPTTRSCDRPSSSTMNARVDRRTRDAGRDAGLQAIGNFAAGHVEAASRKALCARAWRLANTACAWRCSVDQIDADGNLFRDDQADNGDLF